MPQASPLTRIKRFDQLLEYLREELDWPIDEIEVDDLTYDYEPEELGLDPKNAAKIKEIKQLRPLTSAQPWGIFYIRFEPKHLPVTALRRILGKLVTKKRESANAADQKRWSQDDLLFVSAYGENEQRRIDFAHFAEDAAKGLPVLRVLGWDAQERQLKHDWVESQLRENLRWPDEDDGDVQAWRERWRSAFILRHRQVIQTSKALAIRLADLARDIRANANATLEIESDSGPLTQLMGAFREALIHDLQPDDFADMYAQTVAYGLLSARVSRPAGVHKGDLVEMVPSTNPFLRELLETFLNVGGRRFSADRGRMVGIDFDELGVNDVVDTLNDADMEAVLRDFDNRNPQEDPVIHFYELFLKEYDAKKRMQRGVFYTPKPVVSYIVRSVHELLQTEFGLEDGLADTTTWDEMVARHPDLKIPKGTSGDTPFVQILDPATGTATFLVEVIDVIHQTMTAKWQREGVRGDLFLKRKWNEYVPQHLLPRLHGYELMMAPYAIAHMKIGLKLFETGYTFGDDERARIYLTNALEPPRQFEASFAVPALAHEADAVNRIKREQPITVVIGNPPYSGISSNMTPWIDGLLKGSMPDGSSTASYYHVDGQPLGERKLWLQDDYVKFIRWSQHRLTSTGVGIHGYISNHGYLDNPTFRGMRWSIMDAFDDIRVLDLHGNLKKKETPPDGGKDVNVFDIQQGVGIGLFVRRPDHHSGIDAATVRHADLWGGREAKYRWLIDHSVIATDWQPMPVTEPYYLFEPFDQSEEGDYNDWLAINHVMPVNVTGVVTARDGFVIDIDDSALTQRIATYLDKGLSDKQVAEALGLKENYAWRVKDSRQELRKAVAKSSLKDFVKPILYRPFDTRSIFWHPSVVWRPRTEAMPHMLAGENLGLVARRAMVGEGARYFYAASTIISDGLIRSDNRGSESLFPLYLYPGVGKSDASMFNTWPEGKGGRRPNLDSGFVETIEQVTKLKFTSDGRGDLKKRFGPEDVLAYIYAVFHCPEYRRRFEPMLKLDFPRVPPPGAAKPFMALAKLGHDLLALHLLESPQLDKPIAKFKGPANPEVEKVSYADETVWLDKAQTRGFVGVPPEVWEFHIGGYQVCHKWLKDRGPKKGQPGRTLTPDDIAHYQKIVTALSETIRLMKEIDQTIDAHGGWPDAFITPGSDPEPLEILKGRGIPTGATPAALAPATPAPAEPEPEPAPSVGGWNLKAQSTARQARLGFGSSAPAGEPDDDDAEAAPRLGIDEIGRDEVIAKIRELYRDDPEPCDMQTLLGLLRDELGFKAMGKNIRAALRGDVIAASRRGVLERNGGEYHLHCRTIEQYEPGFLREMFLASLGGRAWRDEAEAIRDAARHLGFTRTGPRIRKAFKKTIRALVTSGALERDGQRLRKV